MKKFIIFGALFGLFIVPLSTLGLGFFVAELLFVPFIIIPRWLMSFFIDISSGSSLLIVYLIITSILWYTLLSLALSFLFRKTGKWVVIMAIVGYYLLFALLGVSSTKIVTMPTAEDPRRLGGIKSFEECVVAGNVVMESYPRKCQSENGLFIESVGNELEKTDMIRLDNPRPNQQIISPLKISGEARGSWFFEGDFPVVLTNWDGLIIAEGYAKAQGVDSTGSPQEWMTEEFVPFSAELEFIMPGYSDRGTLILQKDNPSGLPENDDALEIPIQFFKKVIPCDGPGDVCLEEDLPTTRSPKLKAIDCLPEQRNVDACIEIYQPVCGQMIVECITKPCNPIKQTFENSCKACTNSRVLSYTEGECSDEGIIKR